MNRGKHRMTQSKPIFKKESLETPSYPSLNLFVCLGRGRVKEENNLSITNSESN